MKFSRRTAALFLAAAMSTTACGPSDAPETAQDPAGALVFIEDDYELALAQAKERDVPLFIESWAPW